MNKINIKLVNGIVLFAANLDGIEGNLILDTGSVKSTFNSFYFENHKNCTIEEKDICVVKNGKTITQKYKAGTISIDKICFNDYVYKDYCGSVLDLNYVEKPLKALDDTIKVLGTLGMDFISKHLITINYKEQYLRIDSNEKIDGAKFKLELSKLKHPLVRGKIDGHEYLFILDTGSSVCVCEHNYLELFTKEKIENDNNHFIAKDLSVFNITYTDLNMVHIDMTRMSDGGIIVGIIGYPCLKNGALTLDCSNNTLYYYELSEKKSSCFR